MAVGGAKIKISDSQSVWFGTVIFAEVKLDFVRHEDLSVNLQCSNSCTLPFLLPFPLLPAIYLDHQRKIRLRSTKEQFKHTT